MASGPHANFTEIVVRRRSMSPNSDFVLAAPAIVRAAVAWAALVVGGFAAAAEPVADPATASESAAAVIDPLAELETLRYRPREVVAGTLRLAGSTTLEQAAAGWADGFRLIHPDVDIPIEGGGSETGWKKLLAGEAEVALMSRPLTPEEAAAAQRHLDEGRRVVAFTAAFDGLTWIVHADNPVRGLPWSPDTGMLSARASNDDTPAVRAADEAAASVPIATRWGDIASPSGWPEDWKDVPIRLHATGLDSGTRWHLDRLAAGRDDCPLDVVSHPTTADVAAAVAADRGGLGLVSARTAWPDVRAVPLEIPADAAPLPDAVIGSERPPTLRPLFIVVTAPAAGEWPAALREFVSYVLSFSGQLDVAKDGLLPLSRAEVQAQHELLGDPVQR